MDTEQQAKISTLLENCEDSSVLEAVSDYVSKAPEFVLEPGTYDEVQEAALESETGGTIYYTTDEITTPIENKGCLMMFDSVLDVDMDEMIYAYYAGMLGTATKHLPVKRHYVSGYDSETGEAVDYDDLYFEWEWDSNGYPTKLRIEHNEYWIENFSFTW